MLTAFSTGFLYDTVFFNNPDLCRIALDVCSTHIEILSRNSSINPRLWPADVVHDLNQCRHLASGGIWPKYGLNSVRIVQNSNISNPTADDMLNYDDTRVNTIVYSYSRQQQTVRTYDKYRAIAMKNVKDDNRINSSDSDGDTMNDEDIVSTHQSSSSSTYSTSINPNIFHFTYSNVRIRPLLTFWAVRHADLDNLVLVRDDQIGEVSRRLHHQAELKLKCE
jgi:hypothetical protein